MKSNKIYSWSFILGLFINLGLVLSSMNIVSAQYSMIVEGEPAFTEGLTRYKVYVKLNLATDRVSAIYGTDQDVMWIDAPGGVFNTPFNSGWSASGLNPLFFKTMPFLKDDSFATIGLMSPASVGLEGAADPIMVEDRGTPWTPFFKEDGASRLDINTKMGGSWFTLKTSTNGLGDKNGYVLIAQITSSRDISGRINAQIFPNGDGKNSVRVKFEFEGEGKTPGEIITTQK